MIKNRKILVLFGAVVAAGLLSLPWQMGQWKKLSDTRDEREINERRLESLKREKDGERETIAQIQTDPTSPEAQVERIRLLLSQQKAREARDGLTAFEGQNSSKPKAWRALSDLYKEVGYNDKALFYARKCVEAEPESAVALTQLAYLELTLGWRTDAKAHLEAAIAASPDDPNPLLAMALFRHSDTAEAVRFARLAYEKQPENWRIAAVLARDLANDEKYPEALAILEKARKSAPDEPDLYLYLADIEWDRWTNGKLNPAEKAESLKRARANAQRALEMAPFDSSPCFLLGRVAEEEGDFPTAFANYEKELQQHPQNSQNEYRYARLLLHHGETTERKQKGQTLMAKHLEATAAEEKFSRLVLAAAKGRTDAEAHRALARYCESSQRLPRAILEWEEALRIAPNDSEATQNIARLKTLRGDLPTVRG